MSLGWLVSLLLVTVGRGGISMAGATGAGLVPRNAGVAPRYTVDASLLRSPGRARVTACYSILQSLPPRCGNGVPVRGVDIIHAPGAHIYPDGTVTSAALRLVGSWDGSTLTVTTPPATTQPPPTGPATPPGPGCGVPSGGSSRQQQVSAAFAYADTQPDYANGYHDQTRHLVTLFFTGHLDRHRREARRVYSGPLCVGHGRYRARELVALQRQLLDDRVLRPALLGSSQVADRVCVTVAVATPAITSHVASRYGQAVKVAGWLQPVR